VASDATDSRTIDALAADAPTVLAAIVAARAAARARAAGRRPRSGPRRRRDPRQQRTADHGVTIGRDAFLGLLLPAVPDRWRALVALAGGAGLRWGECVGLRWEAVDLDRGLVRVTRVAVEVAGHVTDKPFPKSKAGRRVVPLPPFAVELLREHRAQFEPGPAGQVFSNEAGGPPRRSLFRARVWRLAPVPTATARCSSVRVSSQASAVAAMRSATIRAPSGAGSTRMNLRGRGPVCSTERGRTARTRPRAKTAPPSETSSTEPSGASWASMA
jgi:integrase